VKKIAIVISFRDLIIYFTFSFNFVNFCFKDPPFVVRFYIKILIVLARDCTKQLYELVIAQTCFIKIEEIAFNASKNTR